MSEAVDEEISAALDYEENASMSSEDVMKLLVARKPDLFKDAKAPAVIIGRSIARAFHSWVGYYDNKGKRRYRLGPA